jgi:putative ABC transport system ATP-binding protein
LIEGTVEDNLRFPYSLKTFNDRRFDRGLVETLLGHAGKEHDFLSKRAGDLSGGEAQVVALIRTLQLNPDVMLLDEPTAALDPASSREVESLVQTWFDSGAQARAFIWVTHDPEQAQRMCTTRLTMSAGRLSGASQP